MKDQSLPYLYYFRPEKLKSYQSITISALKEADDIGILVGKAADFALFFQFFNNLWTRFK